MDVRIASETDKEKWDNFVDREGGSFHLYFNWKYYYEANPLKNRFIPLVIEDEASEILGIFPLEENLNLIYGFLTSLPFGVSDGFLIKNSLNEQDKKMVIQSFLDYIDAHYSNSHSLIKIREFLPFTDSNTPPTQILIENDFFWLNNINIKLPCTHILHLRKPFKEVIFKNFFKRLRNQIRHSQKTGAKVIIDNDFVYFEDFIEMQIQMIKKFGVDAKKEDYIKIRNSFKNRIKLFVCLVDSKPISALLCYYTPTTIYAAIGPYKPEARFYLNYTLPMCAAIRDGCESGYQYFCMGFTHTPALAHYKDKFGTTRIPVRIYTKKFSKFKTMVNKIHQYIRWSRKKIVGIV